jgi:hypothetical protein
MGWLINGNDLGAEADITLGDSIRLVDADMSAPSFSDDTEYKISVIHKPSESTLAQKTVELQ